MNAIMTRWATPLTLGLFAVSAVSGVAPLFKTTPEGLRAEHAAKRYKVGGGDMLESLAVRADRRPRRKTLRG